MQNTKEIKFIGYNVKGQRFERTISGVYSREVIDIETKLSTMDMLRYDFVCLQSPLQDKVYNLKKITLQISTEGLLHDMIVLLEGTAYVMNPSTGNTTDTISSLRGRK